MKGLSHEISEERMKQIRAEAEYEFLQEAAQERRLQMVEHGWAAVDLPFLADDVPFRQMAAPGAAQAPSRSGSSRSAALFDLAMADDSPGTSAGAEPETVPEGGDDQRIVLDEFQVTATQDGGYTASQTLAGSRLTTELRDIGSAVAANYAAATSLADVAGGQAASSYKSARGGTSDRPRPASRDASLEWSAGFGEGAPAVAVGETPVEVVTQGYLRDMGATDNRSLLQYTTSTEVAGPSGNFVGAPFSESVDVGGDGHAGTTGARGDRARGLAAPAVPAAIDEAHAAAEPVSTFSLHVSDASFTLAQAALGRGEMPEPARIRPEEFYNAFDYGDPAPTLGQRVACRVEQAAHPFLQQRTLVRVAMKVASSGRGAGQPLRLTVLLDTSGSMEREDRAACVLRAVEVLASLVGPDDRLTLIGFARRPRLLAEAVRGDEAVRLVEIVRRVPADGGTNIEEALKVADELAQRHFEAAAQNRIVLLTDGAANLGNADPAQLSAFIGSLRARGIAFDACGVGTDGLDDEILEALTRRGDGRYYVLDSPEDADAGFARQLAGAFRPAAKNVKVQVRFNSARVGAYRLLGFEKHRLREEDFRDDRVDAAELASEEAAVAVYQVEVLPQGEGELGEVSVRFRDMDDGQMVERAWLIAHDPRPRSFELAAPSLQLAGTAAMLAEVLRGGALGEQVDLDSLTPVVTRLKSQYARQRRVQELAAMFEQLRGRLRR